ncbi:Oligopeptide/dipeptide transporter domain family protein [Synechococcus sp. PCC 7335]|uniref:ABC transporter ATP-binding protein n=1 Tax=Synechococcus sp. (strain ATCC 29403 / PCC 7335) TaxID=91464 RepID=UPI00017ECAC8|nr:dipeptide ABC transporter ATP-binding protein [Synechococcus sp. PCC 7335]EDX87181.1 Oligopeptide/dipeptide transporter domain family protein [Synechococcus sp. PCC 7335]
MSQALILVKDLKVHFPVRKGLPWQRRTEWVKAVDGLSFSIQSGETLGLVGESGCGKSTTGRAILQLEQPTAGKVYFEDTELTTLKSESLRQQRQKMQMIFQDPYASLNPRMTVGSIVKEPMTVHALARGQEKRDRVHHILETVGLSPQHYHRYPHEFSGGQRQRVVIARALAADPDFIVGDEPIAALDVSIQAQVVNLLQSLQQELGLTYLFIAHDLSVVRHIADRVAVMYLGKLMELADRVSIYEEPLHPYTQALLSAVPIPDPRLEAKRERIILQGDVPSPMHPPKGCCFHTRCPFVMPECRQDPEPPFREVEAGHYVACHLVE